MPEIPDAAVQAAVTRALAAGHAEVYWSGGTERIEFTDQGFAAWLAETVSQARREAAKQIAHRIQGRRCAFRACSACLCRTEDARAALDAFPKETPDV
ncbi:hypothetical protein [Streptosporangium sp. NPDC004631]